MSDELTNLATRLIPALVIFADDPSHVADLRNKAKTILEPLLAERDRYRAALERLGDMNAFDLPRATDPVRDAELLARIDYAREVLKT
jgi:hypothetical protein